MRKRKFGRLLTLALGFAAVLFLSGSPLRAQLTEDERNTIDIVKKTKNSVVFITNIQLVRDFFFNQEQVPRGSGSGFLWDDQGHIVTNYHVIEEGDIFSIT
ncbi:MAG: S1C family serine protease, partial [Candidatus Aminicenantes bacterium]|nr:S1C family serine protease [Candidatus Aminicenantes bacterium]